jgi:hypothetical protein
MGETIFWDVAGDAHEPFDGGEQLAIAELSLKESEFERVVFENDNESEFERVVFENDNED